ncbi:MAG TPA: hypothetical protein PKD69_08380, partial [Elusimicrobiota bacterium]|nr:hypothetical protein [Elusimicrobiota bacterium]
LLCDLHVKEIIRKFQELNHGDVEDKKRSECLVEMEKEITAAAKRFVTMNSKDLDELNEKLKFHEKKANMADYKAKQLKRMLKKERERNRKK